MCHICTSTHMCQFAGNAATLIPQQPEVCATFLYIYIGYSTELELHCGRTIMNSTNDSAALVTHTLPSGRQQESDLSL